MTLTIAKEEAARRVQYSVRRSRKTVKPKSFSSSFLTFKISNKGLQMVGCHTRETPFHFILLTFALDCIGIICETFEVTFPTQFSFVV